MTDSHRNLAAAVVNLGEALQQLGGERYVMQAALTALIRAHPAPEAFAAEFRRAWLQLGSPHSNEALGEAALGHIDLALALVEEACPAPLGVRPPRP